jgi:hypothetical protein
MLKIITLYVLTHNCCTNDIKVIVLFSRYINKAGMTFILLKHILIKRTSIMDRYTLKLSLVFKL